MEEPLGYRSANNPSWELEAEAFYVLADRIRTLRKRLLLPLLIVALVVGFVGIVAHALGYWSVLGVMSDGTYLVAAPTFAIAFLIPAAPIFGLGITLYRWRLTATRNAWCNEFTKRCGIDRQTLEERARIFS